MPAKRSRSRSQSRARRRRKKTSRIFIVFSTLAGIAAFIGGYKWQTANMREKKRPILAHAVSDSPAREAALAAVDEAFRAKHEKRIAGAIAALERARRTDPSVPGIDVAFAELALKEKQFFEMRAAAGAAKKKGDHAAGAAVLLGMDKWLSRGPTDREMSAAADTASGQFAEAVEDDLFLAPAWFFWGEVLRYAGREAEGGERTLAALHRFSPWESLDVLAAKVIIASAEAGDTVFAGLTFLPDSPLVRAVQEAVHAHKAGAKGAFDTLAPVAAQPTLGVLASDRFFDSLHP